MTTTNHLTSSAAITQAITKKVIVKAVASVKTLPSPPKVYLQLNALLQEANTDSQKFADIITQDPALAAKVLQFSNSSFLVNGKTLTNITDAITKMGLDTLCCIVMTSELFSYKPEIENYSIVNEQLHSLAVARLAASLVKPALKQEAMLAGLLHDLGKIVLYEINPKLTQTFFKHKEKDKDKDNIALEQKIFNTDHCHISGYLLHTWKFSATVIEAVLLHHAPEKLLRKNFGIAQATYVANQLIHNQALDENFVEHFKLAPLLEKLTARAARLKG
ncbi:MAG: HDOD domain-containing protein [Colwellia sp.]|nr:HDOD domain-containing protein [Colwellia sp.]